MGCDLFFNQDRSSPHKFQSTHPSWGATIPLVQMLLLILISIHAPIVGCDSQDLMKAHWLSIFQSTHPSWGATSCTAIQIQQYRISIHAPIVGCDNLPRYLLKCYRISIHAPIVGCDIVDSRGNEGISISIHAPIVGCDHASWKRWLDVGYFNPRTHRGVRRIQSKRKTCAFRFQSTHPSWGATAKIAKFLLEFHYF